jgi:Ca-activated chloride channel family protein
MKPYSTGWRVAACTLGGVIALLARTDTNAQQPTFTATVDAVRLDVLVTERGRVVRGLTAAEFEVLDNGKAQQLDVVSFEQVPLVVTLAFDLSGSVTGERLDHLRSAGRAVLDGLKAPDQAELLTFGQRVLRRQARTGNIAFLRDALDAARPAGDTSLYDGAFAAMMVGESGEGRNLVLLFSDGVDTSSWLSADQTLASARRANVVVYGATVRGGGATAFLEDLARQTGGGVVEVESTRDLRGRFEAILGEFRQRYLISYTPRDIERIGWHQVTVRVKARGATVRTRPGYQVD